MNAIFSNFSTCNWIWFDWFCIGEYVVNMKGCFTDNQCNNTQCVDNAGPKQHNFCCCVGHMCNSEFKLVTTTTKAPEIEELAPPPLPKDFTLVIFVLIACGIIFVAAVLWAGAYFYKNKKNALFNEIPTVRLDGFDSRWQLLIWQLNLFRTARAWSPWAASGESRTSANQTDWSEGPWSVRCCLERRL